MKHLLSLVLLTVVLPACALAQGFKSSIDFTAAEKAAHARHIGTITKVSRQYLEDIYKEHLAFYKKYRVSKFYGDRNLALNTRAERVAALRAARAPASLIDQLQPTSCIGLTLNALGAGFRAPGDAALTSAWTKINAFVGVAHTGYHVFSGFKGDVIEAHSTRRLDSVDNLEKSPFNPLATGGGPRWTATELYRSGLIGIPPK